MKGLAVAQIVSDEHHSRHFVCACCHLLVRSETGGSCQACGAIVCDAAADGMAVPCTKCGNGSILPLNRLSKNILQDVQVACVECDWNGNYGDYWVHMKQKHQQQKLEPPKSDHEALWDELQQLDLSGSGDEDEDEDLKNFNDWNTSINSAMGFWSDDSDNDEKDEETKDCAEELEKIESQLATRYSKQQPASKEKNHDDNVDQLDENRTVSSLNRSGKSRKESSKKKESHNSHRKSRSSKETLRSSDDADRPPRSPEKKESRPRPRVADSLQAPVLSDREKLIRQAERYKKQANAKFNKGEFAASRTLYSKGIRTMDQISDRTEYDEELLANMLSNRAVTYFREKSFDRTIEDCETAIGLQPKVDKPYIRKWRALMAKGAFDDAYNFVKVAANKTLPESEKLQSEYKRCQSEMEVLSKVKSFMNKGDIVNAQATLDDTLKAGDCDNIVLFMYSARLRITVGDFQPALEKINKALRFNPDYVDALECRGYLYFFSGDMEKASNFLYDAYARHKDCNNLKSALDRVQTTHRLVKSAEDAAAAGNAAESIELYGKAMQRSQPMPPLALLCAQLYIARAQQHQAQNQFTAALQDCQTILQVRPKYGPAWWTRAKVMCALGKPEHAYRDLQQQQASWAKNDPDVKVALKEVEFELRVIRENQTITNFCEELCSGDARRLLRYPSMRAPKRPSHRDLRKSPTNSSPSNSINNSAQKMRPTDGSTVVTGKAKDLLRSGSSRALTKKSTESSRNGVSSKQNRSLSNFDLRNLTDVNETLRDGEPNDRRKSSKRRQESMRELPASRRESYHKSGKSNGRKSNSTSQLKL